ncbi:hypothetical protein PL8927_780197 [Planktothrix serta PCC 8927]|uniref:Uncharacterized protein n=1 Tax=Planktothrix serta PCC 8927 TaxID=671068 RepID=A0A7Z9BVZ6_9CYAN|nr:hypothetical protein [Planktothrix serta]VXD23609.1 hypothetical protein PL8927_780197 [Planktothrix serta PCC 8927]
MTSTPILPQLFPLGIILTLGLSNCAIISQNLEPIPSPSSPSITPEVRDFKNLCENRSNLSSEVGKTISEILKKLETTDCLQANQTLLTLTELYIKKN